MEHEIDELFLDVKAEAVDEEKIRNLEQYTTDLPKIHPNLQRIRAKCSQIQASFELYTIKLEALASEMGEIERENTRLENEIRYQTSIHDHLKNLLLNIEIREDHFMALESESFESTEGLCKMERALEVLNTFDVESYDIRIVREKKERVHNALREFYKRFVTYLSNFTTVSKASEELTVHTALYELMKRFKFIFDYSRRFKDYRTIICALYAAHARKLYDREFRSHLVIIQRKLEASLTAERLYNTLGALLESYRSIIRCEKRFYTAMEMEKDVDDVFANTNVLMLDFVRNLFDLMDIETLNALHRSWRDVSEEEEGVYFRFQRSLRELCEDFKMGYLEQERKRGDGEDGIQRLGYVLSISSIEELNRDLVLLNVERIMESPRGSIEEAVDAYYCIYKIATLYHKELPELRNAEDEMERIFEKACVEYVLSDDGKAVPRLKKLLGYVSKEGNFKNKMVSLIRRIVVSDVEDSQNREMKMVLNKAIS
jgi:hypothetical protein